MVWVAEVVTPPFARSSDPETLVPSRLMMHAAGNVVVSSGGKPPQPAVEQWMPFGRSPALPERTQAVSNGPEHDSV